MIDVNSFSRISTQVIAAGLNHQNWAHVLNEIAEVFPAVSTHLFSQDRLNSYSNLAYVSGYAPDFLQSYEAYYASLNAWAPTFSTRAAGSAVYSSEMCSDADLLKTEFYADWLRPQEELIGGGGGVLGRTTTASALFGGNIRRRDRDVLEPVWMGFVSQILPLMVQAWEINRAIASAEIENYLPDAARRRGAAVLLLRSDGYPTYVNDAAQALIETGRGIQQDHTGRVWISGNAMANQFVRRRKWDRQSAYFEDSLSGGRRLWIAELDPATVDSVDLGLTFGMDSPGVLIVITNEQAARSAQDILKRRYRLTQAEADVVLALGEGLSSSEIAQLRGVSANTVRHQIKQSAAKCGVRRQTELAVIAARAKSST